MKEKMGRPRKKEGVISERDFHRVGVVMSLYDAVRKNGQKHSAAVAVTVELIKQSYSMMRISETEVKRILAAWQPRGSHNILRFECSTLRGEELAKHSWIEAQAAAMSQKQGSNLPAPSDVILPNSVMTYKMSLGERSDYPRHNRKPPKG
jgi:hypothetical protein